MEELLVGVCKIVEQPLGQSELHIQSILHSFEIVTDINKLLTRGNGQVGPVVLMSPGGEVGQDARLATAALTPEKSSSVKALESSLLDSNASDVFWAPMVVAFLVVAIQVEFVLYSFSLLALLEGCAQVFLVQFELDQSEVLHDLGELMDNPVLLIAHLHDSMDQLIDNLGSGSLVTEVWADGAVSQLLDHHIDQAIKKTWRVEEFLEHVSGLSLFFHFDVVQKRKSKVLEDSNVVGLVLEDLGLDLTV